MFGRVEQLLGYEHFQSSKLSSPTSNCHYLERQERGRFSSVEFEAQSRRWAALLAFASYPPPMLRASLALVHSVRQESFSRNLD